MNNEKSEISCVSNQNTKFENWNFLQLILILIFLNSIIVILKIYYFGMTFHNFNPIYIISLIISRKIY